MPRMVRISISTKIQVAELSQTATTASSPGMGCIGTWGAEAPGLASVVFCLVFMSMGKHGGQQQCLWRGRWQSPFLGPPSCAWLIHVISSPSEKADRGVCLCIVLGSGNHCDLSPVAADCKTQTKEKTEAFCQPSTSHGPSAQATFSQLASSEGNNAILLQCSDWESSGLCCPWKNILNWRINNYILFGKMWSGSKYKISQKILHSL